MVMHLSNEGIGKYIFTSTSDTKTKLEVNFKIIRIKRICQNRIPRPDKPGQSNQGLTKPNLSFDKPHELPRTNCNTHRQPANIKEFK